MNQHRDIAYANCKNCQMLFRRAEALRARNRLLLRQLQEERALRARAEQREAELEQARRPTASNSSLPPSANPWGARPPVKKKPTGRRPGGQIGHAGASRRLLAVERMDRLVVHRPSHCQHCHKPLKAWPRDRLIGRHQVAELPAVAVELTEHQSYACRCESCGGITRGRIPEEIAASSSGPRLTAAIGLLAAQVKGSKRDVAAVLGEVLGSPVALGSVAGREAELVQALEVPYQQLQKHVAEAKVKHVDETGWKLRGQSRWLFVAAAAGAVVFRVDKTRTYPALGRLLGGRVRGHFCSDRLGIYDRLPLEKRGLCWAHLKRDFVAVVERGGAGGTLGEGALAVTAEVFGLWRDYKQRRLTRRQLQRKVQGPRRRMKELLEQGAASGPSKTAGLCRALLKREPALWRFAQVPGLAPDNNLAERMLRPAVIWRKKSFGSQSEEGCRYVQRMLSVIQTLRLRGQGVLDYLAEAVGAYRQGREAPPVVTARCGAGQRTSPHTQPSVIPDDARKVA